MSSHTRVQGLVVVGGGPAGLAPIFAAANSGMLPQLLREGVTLLERGPVLGRGALGSYHLESDSAADALLDVVLNAREPMLSHLRSHPATLALLRFSKGAAPLPVVADFLEAASLVLCTVIAESEHGRIFRRTTALSVRQSVSGTWITTYFRPGSPLLEVESSSVLLATGAHQPAARLEAEQVAGEPLLPQYHAKLLQSGELFAASGLDRAVQTLQNRPDPRIVVIGGSTSAAAAAHLLLSQLPPQTLQTGALTLLHRKPLRIFYETVAEARAEGYHDFRASDVCPLSGRVYRLSGFRLASRELMMGALGIGARPPEPRLRLLPLIPATEADARASLRSADLIVAAMGYRPRLLPVQDRHRQEIPLLVPSAPQWSVVNENSCVLTADRRPLPGLFAMGLAVGPGASERLGGEAGFTGQVNSLWLWQHALGENICRQVLARVRLRAPASTLTAEPLDFLETSRSRQNLGVRAVLSQESA